MENPEEVLQSLDEFAKLKPKDIPRELEEYLSYVAKTGDPVYQWSIVKCLFREKLLNVITDFYETCPTIDLPPCPNVDPFNYETMKSNLLERIDSFVNAPFTVQRLCELLTTPRKEYSRVDKFMRAIEKNILVVSTREPGNIRRSDVMPPDFLMNGVMDGRSIDIGEAIETVSSDGVNLMHSDDAEVNISDSDSIRIDCAGAEEIDMDDHSDVETPSETSWEKERAATTSGEDECVKSFEGGGEESDIENESKPKPEASNLEDVESESKEPDSPDITLESFSGTVESELRDTNVDSTTSDTSVTEAPTKSKSISNVCAESKSVNSSKDNTVDKKTPEVDNEPEHTGSATIVQSINNEPVVEEIHKAKPSEKTTSEDKVTLSPALSITSVNESIPETSVSLLEADAEANTIPEVSTSETDSTAREITSETEEDSIIVESTSIGEVAESCGDVGEEISPLESLEEVTSNISPVSVSKDEVTSASSPSSIEITEVSTAEADCGAGDTAEESSVIMETEQEERMEVDDVSQPLDSAVVAVQGDEPMDQSEQPACDS